MPANKLAKSFPQSIPCPEPLQKLYDFEQKLGKRETISGLFELSLHNDNAVANMFTHDRAVGHIAIFGQASDGSSYAVWLRPDGKLPVIRLDSEWQSNSVIASDALEFLRLLAIGYDEIGGYTDHSVPPDGDGRNPEFQTWVRKTFAVTIPKIGDEIITPAVMANDDLQTWIDQLQNDKSPSQTPPSHVPSAKEIAPNDLASLLGTDITSLVESSFIKAINPTTKLSTFSSKFHINLARFGLEIMSDKSRNVTTVFAYSGNDKNFKSQKRYLGKLPENLTFETSRQAVHDALGKTPDTGGDGVRDNFFDCYDRPSHTLHITYSPDESSILLITLMHLNLKV